MTDVELSDGPMIDEGGPGRTPAPKRRTITWVVLVGASALGVLAGVGAMTYSTYTKLDLSLQGLQAAYTAEQTAARQLARKAEELSKSLAEAQSQVRALEASHKASEGERAKQEARSTRLEMAIQAVQTAYAAELATARRGSTQKEEELMRALGQAQAQVRALEASQKASEDERGKLEARSTRLETAIQGLQTTEQATVKKLTERAEELSKGLEQVRARLRSREEQPSDLAVLNHALGRSYSKRGMHGAALAAFQTALTFDPNHAESHFELARLYIGHFEDKRSGVSHLRRYLQLNPTAKDAERVKGWLMKAEKELAADKERKGWGKMDVNRELPRIFD
jgi:tetratricopeptide (TPR) repeat protein